MEGLRYVWEVEPTVLGTDGLYSSMRSRLWKSSLQISYPTFTAIHILHQRPLHWLDIASTQSGNELYDSSTPIQNTSTLSLLRTPQQRSSL